MSETKDNELLERYVRERNEAAFAELTRRHLNLVYSAALRQIDGDAHTAEDVVQMVFTELARQAARLEQHPTLAGWLYLTTRQMAGHVRRSRQRRERREQAAYAMQDTNESPSSDDWNQLSGVLDESMHELPEPDRLALLVRFFEGRELRRVGEVLGLSENAARMRVQRALDKLRDILTRKGIATTTAGLAAMLAANTINAAPTALLATATTAALAGSIAKLGGATAAKTLILTMKAPLVYTSIALVASIPLVIQQVQLHRNQAELAALRQELAAMGDVKTRIAQAEARKSDAEEMESLRRDEAELNRLRQETRSLEGKSNGPQKVQLAKASDNLRKAQAALDAEVSETEAVELREKTVNTMKQMGLAARVFSTDHKDQLPKSMDEIKEFIGTAPEMVAFLERFEFYPQPRPISENEPQLFLFREKEPRKIPGGKWERSYTLADGSVQNAQQGTADFTEWEKKSFGIASAEDPTATVRK